MNRQSLIDLYLGNKKPALFLLFCTCVIVNLFLYARLGVKVVNDSARYLEYAELLKGGFFFDPHNFWYFSYVLFLYCMKAISPDNTTIVIGQCLLSFAGVIALYQASFYLYNDRKYAFVTALLYVVFIEIASWNFYILPESFYSNVLCIALYAIVRIKSNALWYVLEVVVIIIAFFCKPTGVAILIAYLLYVAIKYTHTFGKYSVALFSLVAIGAYLLLNRMLYSFILIENFQKGEIVYGITTIPTSPYLSQLTITPPADLNIPNVTSAPVPRLLFFIFHNPLFFTKIFLAKVFYNISNIRPYWSYWHNIFSAAVLSLIYYCFVRAFAGLPRTPFKIFTLTFVAIQLLILGMTTVDWDGRFLIPLLPIMLLIGGTYLGTVIFRNPAEVFPG